MIDHYRVEWDDAGCDACGKGRTWGIVLPGDDPPFLGVFLGVSFNSKVEAEEWCNMLNQAYKLGKKTVGVNLREEAG